MHYGAGTRRSEGVAGGHRVLAFVAEVGSIEHRDISRDGGALGPLPDGNSLRGIEDCEIAGQGVVGRNASYGEAALGAFHREVVLDDRADGAADEKADVRASGRAVLRGAPPSTGQREAMTRRVVDPPYSHESRI